MESDEYFNFCNLTATELNYNIAKRDYYNSDRMNHCVSVMKKHDSCLTEFLAYSVAFINSIKIEKNGRISRDDLINIITKMLKESHIQYELIEDNGEYFIFSKGAIELDDALVFEPLEWLNSFPKSKTAWIKALKEYSNQSEENYSDIADKFRKALETFFQEFFNSNKTLENLKEEYGDFLKEKGVPGEISNNLQKLLEGYTNYINSYAKHHDKTSQNVLEYLMYQTGNIMRLLITLSPK